MRENIPDMMNDQVQPKNQGATMPWRHTLITHEVTPPPKNTANEDRTNPRQEINIFCLSFIKPDFDT